MSKRLPNRLPKSFNCSTEFTLRVLGGKWKTVILCHLTMGPLRYTELRKVMPALSDKVLTERLRELIEAGLIERDRKGRPESYALAAKGRSLKGVLKSLYDWGEAHAAAFGVKVGHPLLDLRERDS